VNITRKATLVFALGAWLCAPLALSAQTQSGQPQGMPPMPKPGPEHEVLKQDAGTWDAVVEVYMQPGAAPATSKGVETNVMGCGGLCVVTDFKSDMMGTPFEGRGMSTWDPAKKKYVGSWTDSMSTGLAISEGTWDAQTRTFTGWMEGPDMTGRTVRTKMVGEYKPDGTRVFTAYGAPENGKEPIQMRITYTRRK
jgi:hypothetical protein